MKWIFLGSGGCETTIWWIIHVAELVKLDSSWIWWFTVSNKGQIAIFFALIYDRGGLFRIFLDVFHTFLFCLMHFLVLVTRISRFLAFHVAAAFSSFNNSFLAVVPGATVQIHDMYLFSHFPAIALYWYTRYSLSSIAKIILILLFLACILLLSLVRHDCNSCQQLERSCFPNRKVLNILILIVSFVNICQRSAVSMLIVESIILQMAAYENIWTQKWNAYSK